jgi:signal transduction histidine kinase/HPt (histidine-containing phosphotransfer) domain-containing protein
MTFHTASVARRLVLGLVIINAFVYLLAGAALLQSRRHQEASGRTTTQNLARSVASTVSGILEKLDVALTAVSEKVGPQLASGGLDDAEVTHYLRRQKALLRDFEDLWVADAAGDLRWGTNLPGGIAVNISDREYFQALQDAGPGELVISQPVIGRVTKAWSLMIGRRINRPDGSFGGAVVVSVRAVDYFDALFRSMDLGAHGIVALRDERMTLLARHSPSATRGPELGARGISAEGNKVLARNPASGTFAARSPVDGVERTISYEKLARYPLYVFVGLESRELLAPWLSELGTAAGLLIFFTLTTALYTRSNYARARAQLAAREAEDRAVRLERARLQQILDSSPVGISFSVARKLQFANAKAVEMFGSRPTAEVFDFYVDPAERAAVEQHLQEGKPLTRELRMRTTAQVELDVLATYVPTVIEGQAGALAWLIDITERKQTEERIRQINFRNDTALGLTRSGYWEIPLDDSGWYFTSPRACEIFGDPPDPEYRYRLTDWSAQIEVVDPQIARETTAALADVLAGRKEAFDALYPYRRPVDGRVAWIQSHGTVARDASGKAVALYGAAQDITEYIRVRNELARAKDVATAATRAKSEFLANMSHEIRTPLNAILGLAHLVRRDTPNGRQVQRLQQIDDAGRHLLALVNDVLDLSKIEARRLQLEKIPFDVAAVIRQAVAVMAPQAEAKGLRLEARCAPMPARVQGDATRLRQAVLNYLSNAIKFTSEGFVSLRGTVEQESASHVHLRFEVEDSGVGIPADRIDSLFRPFEQVDVSIARKAGGTGLGLAITRYLAAMMGGEVGVTSTPGQGSVFWLTVCLEKAGDAVVEQAGSHGAASAAAVRERHAGARVLLAEDHPIGAEIAADLLQDAGLVVDLAKDGAEAVALARAGHYDVVLMDMQMPGMDGLAATRAIRGLDGWATRPIVAFTANAFAEDRQRCIEAGMNEFLCKPVNPDELYGVLMKFLDAREAVARNTNAPDHAQLPGMPPAQDGLHFEHIETLAGMDPERLRQFRARPAKYVRLFCSLVEQYAEQLPLLRARIAAGEREEAKPMIHALKGAAALMGADALMRAAADLEQSLRAQQAPEQLAARMQAMADALAPLQRAARFGPGAPMQEKNRCIS